MSNMTVEQAKQNCKNGWILNPNEAVVRSIIKGINRNEGNCPCANDSKEKQCPCSNYREIGRCCCRLYLIKANAMFEACRKIWDSRKFRPLPKALRVWESIRIIDKYFDTMDDERVVKIISELPSFVDEHIDYIRTATENQWYDERVLAFFYMAFNMQNYLKDTWPFSHEDLHVVFTCMNISDDVL